MAADIHGWPNWPEFTRDKRALANQLAAVRRRQGLLIGRMKATGFPRRFYGMSAQIRLERTAYYDMLEATQKGDVTP
jgi:Fic family protein